MDITQLALPFVVLVVAIAIWDAVWKLIGMWKAAKRDSLLWFILIAVLNTAGILPIIYIYLVAKPVQKQKQKKN
jgi:hypothetical protein